MVPPILTPLDPSIYTWHQHSPLTSSLWRRLALSNEYMWPSRPKSAHELFINTSLTLSFPIPRAILEAVAARAWQTLRHQIPELVVEACVADDDSAVYMQCRTRQSQSEIDAWVVRTSRFEAGDVLSFEDLRRKVLEEKRGHDSDNAFLLLYSHTRDDSYSDDLVEHVQIMLNVDHQVTDGTGIKIILGKYLSILASALNEADKILQNESTWEEGYKNLSVPWIQHMNDDQVISGSGYEEVVTQNQRIMLEEMTHNPGLPVSQTSHSTSQETHSITLTTTQTSTLLHAIKQNLTPSSNITHLCHAAIVLALLRASPPPPPLPIPATQNQTQIQFQFQTSQSQTLSQSQIQSQSQTLYSPCFLNGRRYLTPTAACPSPSTDFIPICLSFAPIIFTSISELALSSTATESEIREKLRKACRIATEQYGKIRVRKSVLPECVNLFEGIGRSAILEKSTNQARTEPIGQTSLSQSRAAEPFFLSDGLTEQYISHTYPSSQSTPTFTVNTVHFAAHAEQNLIVRMSSWRGCTTISGEWRGCDYEYAMIVRFLEDVVGIMGLVVGMEKVDNKERYP